MPDPLIFKLTDGHNSDANDSDFATPVHRCITAPALGFQRKTTLTITVRYESQEIRDAVIKSGMEHGAAECYDKLAELLASNK